MSVPVRGDRLRRYLAGGAVSLLGIGMLAGTGYDIWDDATNLSWDPGMTLAENVPFLLLAGGLVASGIWLIRSDWTTDHVTTVAGRTLLATVAVSTLLGWTVFLQLTAMDATKPYVIAFDGVLVGAVTSFALSVASTRADIHEEKANETRARNEHLEQLYDVANDLEGATSHDEAYSIVAEAFQGVVSTPVYRLSVDGEVVVDERPPAADDPPESIPIGDRGEIELWSDDVNPGSALTLELFGSFLEAAIRRIERESRIREERDTLEFVNRTLRHDLMNDVALVQARLRMLERNGSVDDSHAEHLRVALDRAEEMGEFVGTVRTYMEAVLNDNQTLEAIRLDTVLEEQVESLGAAYPELSIRCEDLPEVAVRADDLIDRVFDNLLTNAIEHNDAPSPEVTVEVERREDLATVRIADNGPGISNDRRESVFEKGDPGTESGATGFGLYIVKDVVESYDGEIRLRENEPRGTVFELDLPTAGT